VVGNNKQGDTKMNKKQAEILINAYGIVKASYAVNYWLSQPASLRDAIKGNKQAEFCASNEFLWLGGWSNPNDNN
jgi:hypothetical protein